MSKEKVLQFEIIRTINQNGEELRSKKTEKIIMSAEPNYIKLYINTVLTFRELPITLSPVVLELLKLMSYADVNNPNGGQIIRLTRYDRENICRNIDIKLDTLMKALTNLTRNGVLKRIGGAKSGAYQVNPHLFGKGEWKDIKAIQASFDFNTGEVHANIEKEND